MFWNKKKDLIEYTEQEARINAQFQIECADALERASNTLLNILLGGAGGALALFISLYDKAAAAWLLAGTAATSAYLFGLAALLVWGCLWARDFYPPANEPKNLYNENTRKLNITELKRKNLDSKQRSVEKNDERNNQVGIWLNRTRLLAAITPLWLVIGYFIF